jgi:cytochrome c553
MRRLWAVAAVVVASTTFSVAAADVAHGNTLFHTYCVSCHGDPPSGGPETATSGAFIANAIRTVGAMQFLQSERSSNLNDAALDDIYAWLLTQRSAPPPPPPSPVVPNIPGALSGLWYSAAESGWGVHFTQRGTNVFAAWYTYDTSGNPKWYVSTCAMAGGTTGTTGTCSGQLFEVTGPRFFGVAFDTRLVNAVAAGTLRVAFQNADNAAMTYTGVAGQTRTVAITRQPLAAGTTPPAINYTDIWWNSDESGWGIAATQQFATVFLAWYVYDGNAKPTWYVALCTLNGTSCSGDLLRTTGPAFGPTFNSSQVQVFTAGTVSVNFTNANNGVLNYTVNGVASSKLITRQLF